MNSTVDLIAVLERARDDKRARGQASIAESAALSAARDLIDFADSALGYVAEAAARKRGEHKTNGAKESMPVAEIVLVGLRDALVRLGVDVEKGIGTMPRRLFQVECGGDWHDVPVHIYADHDGSAKRAILLLSETEV